MHDGMPTTAEVQNDLCMYARGVATTYSWTTPLANTNMEPSTRRWVINAGSQYFTRYLAVCEIQNKNDGKTLRAPLLQDRPLAQRRP